MPRKKKQEFSLEEIERELLKRRRAQANLIDYARYTMRHPKPYIPADHHLRIAEKLEAVERGEIDRLMIHMPPRHGKTELASHRFPAWVLGRHPEWSIIGSSYNGDKAADFGREVRNIVQGKSHQMLFPGTGLAEDSQAAMRWHTMVGGSYTAAGVGTALTGRGGHILLIDDPVKDREEADSQRLRDRAYSWYMSTAYTRLESEIASTDPDPLWVDQVIEEGDPFSGAIVLIQTLWHDDDLSGRLLRDMERGGDQWDVLSLPAIREEEGKIYALWPEKYPVERLEKTRATMIPREWQSLYQQKPTPDDGDYFKRDWFKWHSPQPDLRAAIAKHGKMKMVITSDFAVSDAQSADFTSLGVWGLQKDEPARLFKRWRGQTNASVWIEEIVGMMRDWQASIFFGESGVIRRAIEPILRRRMKEESVFCRLEWLTRTADKVASARPFQGRAEMGLISLPENNSGEEIMAEMLKFPTGAHDDDVDMCALLGMALAKASPAIMYAPDVAEPMRANDYGIDFDDESNVIQWKIA